MASAPKRAEDGGVNDLGDGGAAMCALRRSQPWEAEAGGQADAGLVLAAGGRRRRWSGDVCAEAQPAMGGGSRRPSRCWFGFGGWRKTGLKKHDRL